MSKQTEPKYSRCSINWENNTPFDIAVYNRDFRNRNFKEDIEGIFTLGNATIEELNALDEIKKGRDEKQADYATRTMSLKDKEQEEQKLKKEFKEIVWDRILKQNEEDFQEAFSGFRNKKEKFRDEVIDRYNQSLSSSETKESQHSSSKIRESLKKRSNTLFAKKIETYPAIDISIDGLILKLTEIENDSIWTKLVVGNQDVPISKLIKHLDNADWVNQGRSYIKDSDICPFCQQKIIRENLEQQLNTFFSGEYENDIQSIKELIEKYQNTSQELIKKFASVVENDFVISIGELDVSKYNNLLEVLKLALRKTLDDMSSKEKEASKKLELTGSQKKLNDLLTMILNVNTHILDHNAMVNNHTNEKKKLVDDIWKFLIGESKVLIQNYLNELHDFNKAKQAIQKDISTCKQQLDELQNKILEAEKNITSVQPTVDEINRSLKAYGFTNFQIVPSTTKANCYQIQRMDGTLATNTLSEGEETFISFLYFFQFAKGSMDATKVSKEKILVLDDPISSLDSTVLYIVSSMVKSLIKEIRENKSSVKQIFILTHNVFFHKEASFIDLRTKEVKDVNYWIIRKDDDATSVMACGKKNPIQTSYQLLWQELKTDRNASSVNIQNTMRRILENYFNILGRGINEKIIDAFDTIEDKMVCRSLISWINEGSHSIPDDFYIDSYTDATTRYKNVFKEIFIKMDHKPHYDMMMADI